MFLVDIVNRGSIPAMDKMLAFTQARHRMLTENVANVDTPGYKTKHLDARAFQESLREALDERKRTHSATFRIRGSQQFGQDGSGRLWVSPTEEPAENILFHDRTNMRIEKQMAMLAENAMMHQLVTDRIKGKYDSLLTAIRGRMK